MYLDTRFEDLRADPHGTPHADHRVAEEAVHYEIARSADPASADPDIACRQREARTLRLAMGLVEGASSAAGDRAAAAALRAAGHRAGGTGPVPDDDAALVARLHRLARAGDRALAEQLRLLPAFEASDLWRSGGCRDCAAWMDRELGIARKSALERLRVARAFRALPVLESLFATGRLGWSKIRALTRVADAGCEAELAAAALDLSASETFALCERWHFGEGGGVAGEGDESVEATGAAAAMHAFERRHLSWRRVGPARVRITLELPTDLAAEYLRSLECAEDRLRDDDRHTAPGGGAPSVATPSSARTAGQYRADAAVLMSSRALAHEGEATSTSDRYRVLLNLDARLLVDDPDAVPLAPGELPPERPSLSGFGPVSLAMARRIAQGAGLTVIATLPDGEAVSVGAGTRAWPKAMERAIRNRDRHCQMPGCTATRWMHVHHVVPVAEGGETSLSNGALVCGGCHRRLHEGGMRLEPVWSDDLDLNPAVGTLDLKADAELRARGYASRVRRFRLLRADGTVVTGPRRRDPDVESVPDGTRAEANGPGAGRAGKAGRTGDAGATGAASGAASGQVSGGVRVEHLARAGSVVSTWRPWSGISAATGRSDPGPERIPMKGS